MTHRKIHGGHVALIFGTAFAVIVSVNLVLAVSAVRTFPGLEVKNSYVASQTFDADRAAQLALDWDVTVSYDGDKLFLEFRDANGPVNATISSATVGRATNVSQDFEPDFQFDGIRFSAEARELPAGNWNLRLKAVSKDGTRFQQRIPFLVES